jgi:glycosyltransferase involved in cell wall biosynthesis
MRVTHVIKAVGIAGAERHLLALLPGLQARGLQVDLVLLVEMSLPLDDYLTSMQGRGVSVERHTMRRHLDPWLPFWLRSAFQARKPDIVHTHLLHGDLYGIPAAKSIGALTVSSRHNEDPFRRQWPLRPVLRGLWQITDAGVAISSAMASFCEAIEGAPAGKVAVIPYGLDHVRLDPAERRAARAALRSSLGLDTESVLIGIASRLIEQKGVTYGLRAFAQIQAQFPQAHLVIAGDGSLRESLVAEASHLGAAEAVHFLGWRQDVPAIMAGLDIFMMPSLWEGFGLTLLEAMVAALPVIGSKAGAIPEIVVDGETGFLAQPQDVQGLADALAQLIQDAPLRHHMGMLGEDRLETHFNAERMIDQTLALYQRLTG